MTNADAEMEIVRRITPEHISQELTNGQTRVMRQFDLQEKSLDNEVREREREHERDQRDRDELKLSDGRLERVFYVLIVSVVVLAIVLVWKGHAQLVIDNIKTLGAALLAVAGGIGVERMRQDRLTRRKRRGTGNADADTGGT